MRSVRTNRYDRTALRTEPCRANATVLPADDGAPVLLWRCGNITVPACVRAASDQLYVANF